MTDVNAVDAVVDPAVATHTIDSFWELSADAGVIDITPTEIDGPGTQQSLTMALYDSNGVLRAVGLESTDGYRLDLDVKLHGGTYYLRIHSEH